MWEGRIYANELLQYLNENQYPLEVGIFEDGTKVAKLNFKPFCKLIFYFLKIVSRVEYDAQKNILHGLVLETDPKTGFPSKILHARTAAEIQKAINERPIAGYVQIILAVPNRTGERLLF
jgi:hypothetical protein